MFMFLALIISCTTVEERISTTNKCLIIDYFLSSGGDKSLQNEAKSFTQNPNFNDLNGSLFGNVSSFYFLTIEDSFDLFIAMNLGSFGSGLYYFDYDGDGFVRMEFDFRHYVPSYIFIEGVRTLSHIEVFPNIIRGFYELYGEYFFITSVHDMSFYDAGAIGKLVSEIVSVYDNEGCPRFTYRIWHVVKYLTLPGSPHVFLLDGENLYIATANQILLVNGDEVTILVYDVMFGSNSPPNAIDKIGDMLFIRTKDGIWLFNVETEILEFNSN